MIAGSVTFVADIWKLVRDNVKTIVPYSPGKSSREVMEELGLTEVTKLASNENPLGPSPKAVAAMQQALQEVHIYPDPTWAELRAAIGAFYDMPPEGVLVGRGSDEIIHMMGLALLNPGDEVIYSLPPFALYPFTATVTNARQVGIPSRGMDHDLEAMLAAVTDRTRLIFVGSPCNPTGTVVKRDALADFMAQVPDHCLVCFDEAYSEYVEDPEYPDTLPYAREGRLTISLRTFSKAYGLAGLRVGYGLAHPEVARAIGLTCEPFNVSLLALVAAQAALGDREHVARSVQVNREGKEYLYGEFRRLGLEYVPTQSNFIFVDVGLDSQECFDGLMRRGVTVRTGEIFGPQYTTFIRVTIGTREQNEKFMRALEEVIAG
jgi:histidinol-phosphate aminotransferase